MTSSVAAAGDAELVKRPRGRLDSGRQRGSIGEVKRRRDRRIVGQHRQLGLGRPLGGQAEHAIADGHVRNALAELVDDTRRLVAQGLRELLVHQALALLPVARVAPAARTAIRTCPGPGCGSGRSTISRTSGPPNWLKRTAFIVASIPGPPQCRACPAGLPRRADVTRSTAMMPARARASLHTRRAASRCECTPPDETVTGHPPASPSRNAGCPWSRTRCASGARPGRESDRQPHLYVVSLTCAKPPRSRTTAAVIDDACGGRIGPFGQTDTGRRETSRGGKRRRGALAVSMVRVPARGLIECGGPTVGGGVRAHAGSGG